MNKLMAGFARVDITPPMGISINGYFMKRYSDGVLDPLEASALALSCGDKTVILLTLDNLGIPQLYLQPMQEAICRATGLPKEALFIHCTHSHTAGAVGAKWEEPQNLQYRNDLAALLAQVAADALADRRPARMGWRTTDMPTLGFSRRFRMKDGTVRTNPGIGNPDILHAIGGPDEKLRLLRFDREEDSLVLMHYGMHPDSVGGTKLSADWPGFARRTFEQAIPNAKVLFFNGAEGDVGVQNVFPTSGDMNDLTLDFDDVYRGYGATRRYGRILAGTALQIYDIVEYVDVETLSFAQSKVKIPANVPTPEQMPQAREYAELHNSDRDDLIPYTGMQLTTVVAEALRMVRLENGPEYFEMYLSAIAIGPVALLGIPGEPFAAISMGVQGAKDFGTVVLTCNTNGYEGYFPMEDSYTEGGYEARSSNFRAGVGELLIAEGRNLLNQL
ncbi:MAG: hypothetical protein IKU07_07925 [Oscillospiraceae bacterium]|nr:hypothetical protein [Oscillospiraceae bacterium]